MDLGEVLRALARRWLVLLIGLVLTGAATYWVYVQTPVAYQSSAQALILLPPNANSPDYDSNPFLYLPNGLNVLARVVAVTPTTPQFKRSMREAGFTSQYELTVETGGSMVTFSAEGANAENVVETRDEIMKRFGEELNQVQDEEGAPARQRAHLRHLARSDQAAPLTGDRVRAGAVGAGIGLVLTLLLALMLDTWLRRRSARKNAARLAEAAEVQPTEDASAGSPTPGEPPMAPGSIGTLPDDSAEVRERDEADLTPSQAKDVVPAMRTEPGGAAAVEADRNVEASAVPADPPAAGIPREDDSEIADRDPDSGSVTDDKPAA